MIFRPIAGRLLSPVLAALAFALALLAPVRVEGYQKLGSDRVLLMNNDTNVLSSIALQGYNDTDQTKDTYWVHSTETGYSKMTYLKVGVYHTFYKNEGEKKKILWHLSGCRAGSGTVLVGRNYLTWSSTAESINSSGTYNVTVGKDVGSVVFRNTTASCLYSPSYEDGIGSIYFDTVNTYTNMLNTKLDVQVATNYVDDADFSFTNYADSVWMTCPVDVLTVTKTLFKGKIRRMVKVYETGVTNICLKSTAGADNMTYRVRVPVYSLLNGYRGKVRFRIRRITADSGQVETTSLIIVDNVIASYPPMSARLCQYGTYDAERKGSEVLGTTGDFSPAYASIGQPVEPHAYYEAITNDGEVITDVAASFSISNPKLIGRRRYLNQVVGDWQTFPLSVDNATREITGAAIEGLTTAVGDFEYFYVADQVAPCYQPVDYAGPGLNYPYGNDWSEALTVVTNRANYAEETPACGHDYFVRVREGVSDYEWVKIVGREIGENEDGEIETNKVSAAMELVGDHTWRYHYYIPTNCIGHTLTFHFSGSEVYTNDTPHAFFGRTNTWWMASTSVPYLPYTSSCSAEDEYQGRELTLTLDGAGTHLLIDFNDRVLSYSVSHSTYQNFNTWTDAMQGFRGSAYWDSTNNSSAASGVSDAKTKYVAPMGDWEVADWTGPYEHFTADQSFVRNTFFNTARTPNGWTASNGMFVDGARGNSGIMAFEMLGRGLGSLAYGGAAPDGVDTITFTAAIAQAPDFGDFAVYADGTTLSDYGISAQITMSREKYVQNKAPTDLSPLYPSVSLVGYWRGSKRGCYELRFTRIAGEFSNSTDSKLCAAFYKWQPGTSGLEATCLASNVLCWTTGGTGWPGTSGGANWEQYNNFHNMLVPYSENDSDNDKWTSALFTLNTKADGSVHLEGCLANGRNTNQIFNDSSALKKVLMYDDTAPGALTKGSFGVGSVGCVAAFGAIMKHELNTVNNGDWSNPNANLSGEDQSAEISPSQNDAWDYLPSRWRTLEYSESVWRATGLSAVKPASQTVKLDLAESGTTYWQDSGMEETIDSYNLTTFTMSPRMTESKQIRLRTGGEASDDLCTDVVIGDVTVTEWLADNVEGLSSKTREWVYTRGVVEPSADSNDKTFYAQSVGTNGYIIVFTNTTKTITYTPREDMVIDRILVVGGGGAGGNVMGGGGGGGGVVDCDWSTNAVTVAAGATLNIVVGAGGAADAANNRNAGKDGGQSSVKIGSITYAAKGGGGGGGWSAGAGRSGASGGGGSNQKDGGSGTSGQGYAGGQGSNGRGGGGGGAGGAGSNYVAGVTAKGGSTVAARSLNNAYNADGGAGGIGKESDITGKSVVYGGGGGGGAGWSAGVGYNFGGEGGEGGGGRGADAYNATTLATVTQEDGTDGLGGGGGGGGGWVSSNTDKAARGGKGGNGIVILRVRTGAQMVVMQPARATAAKANSYDDWYPVSLRSPYLENGMALMSFNYLGADSNAVVALQICTNMTGSGYVSSRTREPDESEHWATLTNWSFRNATATERKSGTFTYYMSLRAPASGLLRLIVPSNVVAAATSAPLGERDADYGKITITQIYCYDEPALDVRSWWGWNLHTEGWNTAGKDYAYLVDSPSGLSGILNFSSLKSENATTLADTRGIGLSDGVSETDLKANNAFVQSPALTNGVGTVSFRARAFGTNQTTRSWVTLYGTSEPDSDQTLYPDVWTVLTNFEVSADTYHTYNWKTTEDSTIYQAIRLEINGSRRGRTDKGTGQWDAPRVNPIQRLCIDEITVAEPIAPQLSFRDVRPFRSHIADDPIAKVPNVDSTSEQPITGESWGLQATVEPQQMSEELVTDSVRVYAAFFRGTDPWGYEQWKNRPTDGSTVIQKVELSRVKGISELVFRSSYDVPLSIANPEEEPNTCWQYYVWAEYDDKSGVHHSHGLTARDWSVPSWYYGLTDYNLLYGSGLSDKFSGYTILDTVSPKRMWINEMNYWEADGDSSYSAKRQYIEFAVPQGADLEGWQLCVENDSLEKGPIAVFGYDGADVPPKAGTRPGIDAGNHYTVVTLRSPAARDAGLVTEADGEWNKVSKYSLANGSFYESSPYGVYLMRPSGIIEHQIVTEGKSIWEGTPWEGADSATNLVDKLKTADGEDSQWFFAGSDKHADRSFGVMANHGEFAADWTNSTAMVLTPGAFNQLADGTKQEIDPDWFLPAHGTNIWIYAMLLGDHLHQQIGMNSNRTAIVIVRKGDSTNIVYTADAWYEMGEVTVNGTAVTPVAAAKRRTWTLALKDLSETTTVYADEMPDSRLEGVGLAKTDRYYNAVMAWLAQYEDDTQICQAEYRDLANAFQSKLDIKDMYWLNIPPNESGWWLKAGMGSLGGVPSPGKSLASQALGAAAPSSGASSIRFQTVEPVTGIDPETSDPCTNIRMTVTMIITNTVTGAAHAPGQINGLDYGDGTGSSSYNAWSSPAWTSATFKVMGALQKPGDINVSTNYLPLRWFVFGPNSFRGAEDANPFTAVIEVHDPHSASSPGSFYGWGDYPDASVFFKWRLDGESANLETTEMLNTNSVYSIEEP